MAFNDFRKRDGSSAPGTQAAGGGVGALTAFIDQGSEFSGKLSFKDTVRIDGRFDGQISSENTLIVGESGVVKAEIRSEVVIVSGEVHGEVYARSQITLHKTANVFGNLHTKSLMIEDGAQFNGAVEMTGNAAAGAKGKPLPAKPQTPSA
jgi:cytoskeletal protein CcmA (bactofilin family)